jgi:hypothetical protein
MFPSDRVPQLYPLAPGSLLSPSITHRATSGGILTFLHY